MTVRKKWKNMLLIGKRLIQTNHDIKYFDIISEHRLKMHFNLGILRELIFADEAISNFR